MRNPAFALLMSAVLRWLLAASSEAAERPAEDRSPRFGLILQTQDAPQKLTPPGDFSAPAPSDAAPKPAKYAWGSYSKRPAAWFATPEGVGLAESLLTWQNQDGGWVKNHGAEARKKTAGIDGDLKEKDGSSWGSTIDNGATINEMRFVARAFGATHDERFKASFLRGFDYLLRAQYPNGGWPQRFPLGHGYGDYITFNDDAMLNVMQLISDVAAGGEFEFVGGAGRAKAGDAAGRGVDCILKCQIVTDGRLTGWCAQHDPVTFEPRPARTYEKVSLSGSEGARVAQFLMRLPNPDERIKRAVNAACEWFERVKITGIKTEMKDGDKVVVEDPAAPVCWARFYEIGTNRPIFCGRDGVIKYSLAEIEKERRTGYGWYTDTPTDLLAAWPAWKAKWEAR